MKNTKKLTSLILALVMCLSLCVPAFAAEAGVRLIETPEDGGEASVRLLGTEQPDGPESRRAVMTYEIAIPHDGEYHELGTVELVDGDAVSFNGTWGPSFAQLSVEVISADGGYGTMTGIRSGGSGSLKIRQSGIYIIHAKAVSTYLSGTTSFTLR